MFTHFSRGSQAKLAESTYLTYFDFNHFITRNYCYYSK